MEQKPPKPMTPFDNLVTPPFLYTLKLLLPYTPPSAQRFIGIYIKFLELHHTMEYFQGFSSSPSNMLEGLKPYMDPAEKEMMEQMSSMMNMMEMVRGIKYLPEGTSDSSAQGFGAFNPMDMMKGMLSPEQQEMFEMYSTMFEQEFNQENNHGNNPPDTGGQKGDAENE